MRFIRGGARERDLARGKGRRGAPVHIEEKEKQTYCKENKTVRSRNEKEVTEQVSLKDCGREQKKHFGKMKGSYRTVLIASCKCGTISIAVIIERLDR